MRSFRLSPFKLTALIAFLLIGAIALLGIYDCHPTVEDISRLQTLSDRYPRYKLSFDCDLYLKVVSLDPLDPNTDQAVIDIYNTFFAKEDGKLKRKTPFVYVNFYNDKNDFQYQLIHNWKTNVYEKGNREFY